MIPLSYWSRYAGKVVCLGPTTMIGRLVEVSQKVGDEALIAILIGHNGDEIMADVSNINAIITGPGPERDFAARAAESEEGYVYDEQGDPSLN